MESMPTIILRGNVRKYASMLLIAIILLGGSLYGHKVLGSKKAALTEQYASMSSVDAEQLEQTKISLTKDSDALTRKVNELKTNKTILFDKDVFNTSVSTLAEVNHIKLTKLEESNTLPDSEGFYKYNYQISMAGSLYGIMELFNLINTMGYDMTVEGLSFRQQGDYDYLARNVSDDVKDADVLAWIDSATSKVSKETLLEMIKIANRIENDSYDYGTKPKKSSSISSSGNSIDRLIESLTNGAPSDSVSTEDEAAYEKALEEYYDKQASAKEDKEKDLEELAKFLEENYPKGTTIVHGQLMIPSLDGKMKLDLVLQFNGNKSGAQISDDYLNLLVAPSMDTSKNKMKIYWNGKSTTIPSTINGVDVSLLDGINITTASEFVVSWNNNKLNKKTVETILRKQEDGGLDEYERISSELRFLQKNGKINLDMMKYQIFLYKYLKGKSLL